jgi:Histidine kinase-, DNA gyrase B-, and HSP90-like ATPase
MQVEQKAFRLDFSNRVIEHLGIKLYQNKPTNVIAEFLSNSWDGDASHVTIDLKANDGAGTPEITIVDDGRGMTRSELTDEFLVIGRNRRVKPDDKTEGLRAPMGRKGIGKLAGFGIARMLNVVSIPNAKRRAESPTSLLRVYWLRFDLNGINESVKDAGPTGYEPIAVADGVSLQEFKALADAQGLSGKFAPLIQAAERGEGGVCVHLYDTTLKKAVGPDALLKSLGSRFTVTLLRPDFVVTVNGKQVQPADAFPPFLDFGFGTVFDPIQEKVEFGGVIRSIKYWARFVALADTEWPLESAGVGVYAHGKIAQDRPFFFGVRGKEIFSRYLYAVVEADWLDEMPTDVVSTDRRSVDWDTEATAQLHAWGAAKVSAWIEGFNKWRKERPKKEVVDRIRAVSPTLTLSAPEEEALADLLTDVLPNMGNDEEAKDKTTARFKAAWTHEPTRRLTKELWAQVFSKSEIDSNVFGALIERLKDSLVPEAMGLAVTMAQRIAAITAMRTMIEFDKTETHLQRLIEQFPWLLGPNWERLTANQTIRTLVTLKHQPNRENGGWSLIDSQAALKPDFVFLSDIGQKEIVVFELKGPEYGKTLNIAEYHQLREYLDIISGAYPNVEVRGILVGHDSGGFKETDRRIDVEKWADVLARARGSHISYLAALLQASEPGITDARLQQIADFGGAETLELLRKLQSISSFPSVVIEALTQMAPGGGAVH